MKRLKKMNELHFDRVSEDNGKVRFYLFDPDRKTFMIDINREDIKGLEEILKRNNIDHEVDDGSDDLPF